MNKNKNVTLSFKKDKRYDVKKTKCNIIDLSGFLKRGKKHGYIQKMLSI